MNPKRQIFLFTFKSFNMGLFSIAIGRVKECNGKNGNGGAKNEIKKNLALYQIVNFFFNIALEIFDSSYFSPIV